MPLAAWRLPTPFAITRFRNPCSIRPISPTSPTNLAPSIATGSSAMASPGDAPSRSLSRWQSRGNARIEPTTAAPHVR